MGLRCWLSLLILASASGLRAQDADALFHADTTISAQDSLSIFNLIDSLLELQESQSSQLALRLSYNSNVLSAGRTLGIENFGLSPGVSYFHTSGLYADATAFWSKNFEPSYYLTVLSAGYMRDFSQHFSVMAGYDKYIYNFKGQDVYIPYRNTLSATPMVEVKPFSLSVNYSFYFGDQYAHRVMPGMMATLQKKKLWNFDRVSLSPSFFLLWGNEIISTIEYVPPATLRELFQNLRDYGTRYRTVITENQVFGIMNYAISVPLNISYKNWGFSVTYIYNIPKALPGEPATLSESTFLTGSLMYLIDLRSRK
ncbi:MAG TPA: hypothetical protein VGD65_17200 [Chryseosolibacter sp.]